MTDHPSFDPKKSIFDQDPGPPKAKKAAKGQTVPGVSPKPATVKGANGASYAVPATSKATAKGAAIPKASKAPQRPSAALSGDVLPPGHHGGEQFPLLDPQAAKYLAGWDAGAGSHLSLVTGKAPPPPPYIHKSKKCYEDHPALSILKGHLHGGNCRDHAHVPPCDLYIALDGSHEHPKFSDKNPLPVCIYYPIQNMGVPNALPKFKSLVTLIVSHLSDGKRVHIGCIGGHGRTGLVIAAVVAMSGTDTTDPIGYVRKHYCKKAVESKAQIDFLVTNFGAMPAAGSYAAKGAYGFE